MHIHFNDLYSNVLAKEPVIPGVTTFTILVHPLKPCPGVENNILKKYMKFTLLYPQSDSSATKPSAIKSIQIVITIFIWNTTKAFKVLNSLAKYVDN